VRSEGVPPVGTITRPAYILTLIIAALAGIAAAGGLLLQGLYRDNAFVTSTWQGNDLTTLLLLVPLLLVALALARRGSARGYLVWLALVESMLYNFGFYLFGAAFNWFFLLYAAIFACSIWAFFIGLVNLDVSALKDRFSQRTPVRSISAWMLFVGFGLSAVYVAQWAVFALTGDVPPIMARTAQHTNVVFALDLALVIPLLVVGAVWLWRRKPWGYAIATIVNLKGAVYMVGLCASTYTAYRAGTVESLAEITIWGTIGAGCLIASAVLLHNLKRTEP